MVENIIFHSLKYSLNSFHQSITQILYEHFVYESSKTHNSRMMMLMMMMCLWKICLSKRMSVPQQKLKI